jgi:AbrB family looped-hinge helix DNA binding protein
MPTFHLMPELIEVTHVSKRGVSLRVTLPKKIAEHLGIQAGSIVGFYKDGNRVYVDIMK